MILCGSFVRQSHFVNVVNFTEVVTAVFEMVTSISVVKSSFDNCF